MGSPVAGIGVAVYNSASFLRETLDSVLAQTFTEFVVYLRDDCSTDESADICREYAAKDPRILFKRNETNMGALANHRSLLAEADTEFFMFVRCHEVIPPNLLQDGLDILRNEKEVVLAFARSKWIDQQSNIIPDKQLCFFDTRGMDAVSRSA
ncbi:MAG: glycosyltransferase, partial [Gammaproteobacteria bacterium]